MFDDSFEGLTTRQLELRLAKMFSDAATVHYSQPPDDASLSDRGERSPETSEHAERIADKLTKALHSRKLAEDQRPTVSERMLILLRREPDRIRLSRRDWADELQCSEAAIQKTPTWQLIKEMRKRAKLDRAERDKGRSVRG